MYEPFIECLSNYSNECCQHAGSETVKMYWFYCQVEVSQIKLLFPNMCLFQGIMSVILSTFEIKKKTLCLSYRAHLKSKTSAQLALQAFEWQLRSIIKNTFFFSSSSSFHNNRVQLEIMHDREKWKISSAWVKVPGYRATQDELWDTF